MSWLPSLSPSMNEKKELQKGRAPGNICQQDAELYLLLPAWTFNCYSAIQDSKLVSPIDYFVFSSHCPRLTEEMKVNLLPFCSPHPGNHHTSLSDEPGRKAASAVWVKPKSLGQASYLMLQERVSPSERQPGQCWNTGEIKCIPESSI